MGKIEVIEKEVSQLSLSELAIFREWFLEFDAAAWDNRIEQDSISGKLDKLAERAIQDFNSGNISEF